MGTPPLLRVLFFLASTITLSVTAGESDLHSHHSYTANVTSPENAEHSRQKRWIAWNADEKRITFPPGTILIFTPTLAVPFLRNLPKGYYSDMTISAPFKISFDDFGITDEFNPWGLIPGISIVDDGREMGEEGRENDGKEPAEGEAEGEAEAPPDYDYDVAPDYDSGDAPPPPPAAGGGGRFPGRRPGFGRGQGFRGPRGGQRGGQRGGANRRRFKRSRKDYTPHPLGDRLVIFEMIEDYLMNLGHDGKACLLRAICETNEHPLPYHGLFGEFLQMLFSVSLTPYADDVLPEYMTAEKAGKERGACWQYRKECKHSLFSTVTENKYRRPENLHHVQAKMEASATARNLADTNNIRK